jgi:hypothetical protein
MSTIVRWWRSTGGPERVVGYRWSPEGKIVPMTSREPSLIELVFVLVACVIVTFVLGCGARIDPRVRAGCQGVGDVAACERLHQGDLEAWEALSAPPVVAPVVAQPAYQGGGRVFIHRWQQPGSWPNPAPLGYIDLP